MLLNAPQSINWNFTDLCGFNCLHCYTRGRASSNELRHGDLLKVAHNLGKARVFVVNLGGGEPIIRESELLPVIEVLSSYHLAVHLSSNGWLLDTEKIMRLKNSGLNSLFLSIDSCEPKLHDHIRNREGTFEKALKTIEICNKNNLSVAFSTVVNKLNWREIPSIIELAISLGVSQMSLKRFRPVGNGNLTSEQFTIPKSEEKEMLEIVGAAKTKYADKISVHFIYSEFPIEGVSEGCPCGRTSLALMPNGDVKMCVYGKQVMGNLLVDDLKSIWVNHPLLIQNRKRHICEGMGPQIKRGVENAELKIEG